MNWKKSGIYLFGLLLALLLGRFWGSIDQEMGEDTTMSFVRCSPNELGYSCSMHPQMRVRQAGDCPFCQMPLVKEVVLPGAGGHVRLTAEAAALADIQTTIVGDAVLTGDTLEVVGKVASDHNRIFTQVANLPGQIEKLYAQRPGQWISKGDPIARIYSKELISAVEAIRRPNTPESLRLSARNNLREWQVPGAVFDALVAADDYRQAVDIYATASGLVKTLEAHVGEKAVNTIMGAPTTLYTLVDLSTVWIELAAHEGEIRYLRVGQAVRISVDAFPGKTYIGKVISLATAMNEASRTLPVIVSLPNPRLQLRPGMLARARITVGGSTATTLQIPRSAVLWTGKRSVVFIKRNLNGLLVYRMREVELGDLKESTYEVLSGLEVGEEIVTNGAFTIDAAAQLQGGASMMNRGSGLEGL
jgi:Cu(I)/Ag(I) efflux system membrane fusion protein